MIGHRQLTASRLLAAALLTLGCALMLAPAPAAAQEEQTPWYMPQAWVRPPATGPQVQALPGYYGNSFRYSQSSYGSFSTGCYGDCGMVRGTISTGNGVVLFRPMVVAYDQRAYQIVPRGYYGQTRYVYVRAAAPRSVMIAQRSAHTAMKPGQKQALPQYSTQNGVRIIRPAPPATN
jgi:hypothetical protein